MQDYPEPVPAPTETFQENLKLVDLEFANSYPCHWARWGTLLQTAVEEGKAEHLRLILERGVDPFVTAQFPLLHPSKYQRLPLFIACERKNMEMVKILEEYMNMTDDLKLKQLAHYILGDGRESASDEFFKILSTLPLDLVRNIVKNIARIANAVQCHSKLSGNKYCHEFNFSIVRNVISVSNVISH